MTAFRWGVLGTGGAATSFVAGLASTESSAVTVASRRPERAKSFAAAHGIAKAHASFEDAIAAGGVDAFYLATPSSTHRDLAIACLDAGIPVLVEKPFATNAADARAIADAAERTGVFCMEAMWTRFLPAVGRARAILRARELGSIRLVTASFGIAEAPDPASPLFDPALGGGALLDRAVYPISLIHDFLGTPADVASHAHVGPTGVDEHVTVTLSYEDGLHATVIASLTTPAPNDLTLMGTGGLLRLHAPIYRPARITQTAVTPRVLHPSEPAAPSRLGAIKNSGAVHKALAYGGAQLATAVGRATRTKTLPYAGNGYGHEADEVIACIAAGRTESEMMPLAQSVAVLETLDQARARWTS